MSLRKEDFERELIALLAEAEKQGRTGVTVSAGELHRRAGGYPGPDHRMPSCCNAMRSVARTLPGTEVPNDLKLNGASFAIKFKIRD